MTDDELDRLVASTMVSDPEVRRMDLAHGEAALLEEIMSTPSKGRTARRAVAVALVAAATVALAIAVPAITRTDTPAYAGELVRIAEANERLVVALPGWSMTRADELTLSIGETEFGDGTSIVTIRWTPAAEHGSLRADRALGNTSMPVTVAGRTGTAFNYAGTTDYAVILDPVGPTAVELRADLGGEAALLDMLDAVERVSVDEWLAALPDSAVTPEERAAAVDEMLVGIPLPDGFDRAALRAGATTSDRYQLGAHVTGAVACAWLDIWFDAVDAGDEVRAQQASDALMTSKTWPILLEMDAQGGWSGAVWQYADATAGGGVITGGGPMPITPELAAGGLGCPG